MGGLAEMGVHYPAFRQLNCMERKGVGVLDPPLVIETGSAFSSGSRSTYLSVIIKIIAVSIDTSTTHHGYTCS